MKKKITAIFLCVALVAIAIVGASLAYFTDTTENVQNTFTMGGVDIDLTEPKWNKEAGHKLMPGVTFDKDPTITVKEGSDDSYVFLELSLNKYNSLLWVMAADASEDDSIDFTIFDENGNLKSEFKNADGQFSTTAFLTAVNASTNKGVFQAIVNKWFGGIKHTDWEVINPKFFDTTTNSGKWTIRLAYIGGNRNGVLSANEKVTFMTSFGMPASVTQEMINNATTIGGQQNKFNTDDAPLRLNFKAYAVQAQGFDSAVEAWNATFGK